MVKETMHDYYDNENVKIFETQCGNAGLLNKLIHDAVKWDVDAVYFAEDDYLYDYETDTEQMIIEGLKTADYMTFFDHPDKYQFEYQNGEVTKVVKTDSSHWKYTTSTTMTFGCRLDALKRDFDIWDKHTCRNHPHDHHIFLEIGYGKLISCIPGVACHVDLTYSNEKNKFLIDDFAIKELESYFENKGFLEEDKDLIRELTYCKDPLKKLMGLAVLCAKKNGQAVLE
jgi:hypothetical protein